MSNIDSLRTLLIDQLRDLLDAEQRLTKALPKMKKATTNDELREAIEAHFAETEEQVSRLEEVFEAMGETARAKPCPGMRGIIEEGDEHISQKFADDGLRDAAIIGAAQRVEHYEIAAYGTALAHARLLGLEEVVSRLEQTLEEEKAADVKLTEIAEGVVNLDAASGDGGVEMEEGEAKQTAGREGAPGRATAGDGRAASGDKASRMARMSDSDAPSRRQTSDRSRGAARDRRH
jgi:ferritin-like metal-binding protein YciE